MRRLLCALAFFLLPIAGLSCNISGQPCGLLNVSACGGSPSQVSCAAPGALMYECNVVNGPNTVPVPLPVTHNHSGYCGSFYCAVSGDDVKVQTGANGDPALVCSPVAAPPSWSGCIEPRDAGPCANLGEACSAYGRGGPPDCCPYQQVVSGGPASNLECEANNIESADQIGVCRVDTRFPCNTPDDCFQHVTPDDNPADCQDICCYGEGRSCWSPGSGAPNDGCCIGLHCVPDAIGNGYWCQ